jgi:hypothetical protein
MCGDPAFPSPFLQPIKKCAKPGPGLRAGLSQKSRRQRKKGAPCAAILARPPTTPRGGCLSRALQPLCSAHDRPGRHSCSLSFFNCPFGQAPRQAAAPPGGLTPNPGPGNYPNKTNAVKKKNIP